MAGSIKTCPNCGEYVLPPAVQVVQLDGPPYQKTHCVACGWRGFVEELILKPNLNILLAGTRPPNPFVFNTGGSAASDSIPGPPTLLTSSPSFTPLEGETVVACVHTVFQSVSSATCGSTPMTFIAEGGDNNGDIITMFYLPNAPMVPSTVTVDTLFSSIGAVVVVRFTGHSSLSHVVSQITSGDPFTTFDSGLTPDQTGTGHIAIAAVVVELELDSTSVVFGDSFSTDISADAGGPAPFAGVCIAAGHRVISGTTPVRSTGTYPTPSARSAMVAVFKP